RQLVEWQGRADDRHDRADVDARLLVASVRGHACKPAEGIDLGRLLVDREELRDELRRVLAPELERGAATRLEPRRWLTGEAVVIAEGFRDIPSRAAWEDPDRAAVVADPEAHRSLVVEERLACATLRRRHLGPVVDASVALERRDDRELVGLDLAGDPDLAHREAGDAG